MSDAWAAQSNVAIVQNALQAVIASPVAPLKGSPRPGPGYLSGTYPGGITSVLGSPASATIRVMYRPAEGAVGDGVLVAQTTSAADGSWIVRDLDPNLKFDVVCRKAGYNDLILCQVSPVPYSAMTLANGMTVSGDGHSLQGSIAITGGTAPYSLSISGEPPPGVTFSLSGATVVATGSALRDGDYSWTVSVSDASYRSASLSVTATNMLHTYPPNAKTAALLHFEGANGSTTFTDETGKTWTAEDGAAISTAQKVFGGSSLLLDGVGDALSTPTSADLSLDADFTISVNIRLSNQTNNYQAILASGQATYVAGAVQILAYGASAPVAYQQKRVGLAIFGGVPDQAPLLSNSRLDINRWYHLVVTRQGTVFRMFIDGKLEATYDGIIQVNFGTVCTYIGRNGWDGAAEYFAGNIDELLVVKGAALFPTSPFSLPIRAWT